MTQHQRRGGVADGELDLRQPVARGHRADEVAQGQQQIAHVLRHDLATRDVGDKARFALVEADQHLALLGNVSHREPGPAPVAPGRPFERPEHALGPHFAEVPECVFECPLLGRDLCRDVKVLHLAAAADAEVRATRHDALRARPLQRRHRRLLPVVLLAVHGDPHLLAGQRVLDEDDLALGVVGHALRLEVERLDGEPLVRHRHGTRLSGASPRTALDLGIQRLHAAQGRRAVGAERRRRPVDGRALLVGTARWPRRSAVPTQRR